ncbi:MAG: tRNA threonylcarbamoyladenosine biosynthesis protein RimN [Cycloclasticus sp. symbiont of Bathymodiolus heckerae]|nr:MAG: tRNA threonylcarbamoyladenosine biosynthesis protein RimN [Cycloclasticus sp. symbiont of Bathymodiolus heckerae]
MPSIWQKRRFVETLHQGGLVAYPTEAVFGLGCDPFNVDAVSKLLALKSRSLSKGLILITADFSQVSSYIKALPESVMSKIHDVNQEPTTWLLPAKESVPKWLTGDHETLGIRFIQHGLAKELCTLAGMPLVSTSANISGCEPVRTACHARLKFHSKGVHIINGCVGGAQNPSRIINPLLNKQIR